MYLAQDQLVSDLPTPLSTHEMLVSPQWALRGCLHSGISPPQATSVRAGGSCSFAPGWHVQSGPDFSLGTLALTQDPKCTLPRLQCPPAAPCLEGSCSISRFQEMVQSGAFSDHPPPP